MKFKKLVILEKTGIEEFALEELKLVTDELVVYSDIPRSNEEIIERAKGADCVLVSWNTKIDKDTINKLTNLKYIGMCCTLYNDKSCNINLATAKENGITVTGVREYGDHGVVQYLFSELIRLLLGTGKSKFTDEAVELESLKMGIIGLGSVGKKVAQTADFFNMDVYYYDHKIQDDLPYTYLPMEELLKECDIISLHLPKNNIVIGSEEFDILKGKKILINTALGFSFDREAFGQWIESDEHFGIFDTDSIDDDFRDKYNQNNRVIMNSVVSGFTRSARKRLAEKVLLNIKGYLGE